MSDINEDVRAITSSLKQLQGVLKQSGDDVRAYRDETNSRLSAVEQLVVSMEHNGNGVWTGSRETIGAQIVRQATDSQAFAHLAEGNQGTAKLKLETGVRAALTNSGSGTSNDGAIPRQPEQAGIVGPVMRQLRLLDVLPSRPTTRDSVEYVQLSVTGEASEQETEGATKAEISVDGDLQTAQIATVAAWLSASKQVLSDHATLQAQIDRLIRHKLLSKLEYRLINGTGGQNKIDGLLSQGTIFVPSIGASAADVIGEALSTQSNYGFSPGVILMNPFDWFKMQIVKTNTEGEYLFGSPTAPVPPVLWNTPVVTTPSVAEGTAMTVDTAFTTVLDREQLSIMLSNSHSDFFIRNLVAILGELRAGLEVLDTQAIYKMDISPNSN